MGRRASEFMPPCVSAIAAVSAVALMQAGAEGALVLKIENEQGEELLGGGPNAGGPEPRTPDPVTKEAR